MNQLGKFNGVLLVSDFDDTLYGEDMRITRENVEALTYFTREGGTFTVATGRARPNFAPHASHIPINAPVILSNGSALYDFRTGEMIREGGTFTVATGRARPNFAPHASHIPINAPVILSNGSALYDFRTGEMIYETFLPDRVREDLQQMARAIPTIGFEAYHHDAIYVYQPNAVTQRHLERAGMTAREVPIADIPMARAIPTIGFEAYHHDAIYVYQPNAVTQRHLERAGMTAREVPIADIPLPWSKVILQQDYETLLHTQRYLLERWGEHYEVIFSNRVLLELTRKGSSKGGMVQYLARRLGIDAQHIYCVGDNQNDIPMLAVSAIPLELTRKGSSKGGMVQYLARRLGIDAQHIYCVGDNQNDIPMLAVSAIPFAPANCAPEVKQWGARILGACEESCVAQIVDILDHIYA